MSAELNEQRYRQLVEYLRSSKRGVSSYPDWFTANQKRGLRQQAECFRERDGVLLHCAADSKLCRVVVNGAEKERLIKACHSGVDGGHFGRDKTQSKLSDSYWWKGMGGDVADYCKKCDQCQRVNNRLRKTTAELHPIPVTAVWDQIGIDLIGPLPKTSRGNKYIITATDYFSKWPEAGALPDKTAIGVANFLFTLFCRHGWPKRIISDQGKEFVNAVSRCLYDRTNVEHRISSPYHPQTNGLDERTNQTLVRTLKKLTKKEEDWDQHIDAALYAYRISVQDSSRFSPFFLIYNRHPRKAIDFELATVDGPASTPKMTDKMVERTMDKLLYIRQKYHEKAHSNIQVAQERQKFYFDAKHDTHHHFAVGTKVLLKNMKNSHRMGGKMDPKWLGPYIVKEKVSKGRYKLYSMTGKIVKKMYSSCLLKEYFEPSSNDDDADSDSEQSYTGEKYDDGGECVSNYVHSSDGESDCLSDHHSSDGESEGVSDHLSSDGESEGVSDHHSGESEGVSDHHSSDESESEGVSDHHSSDGESEVVSDHHSSDGESKCVSDHSHSTNEENSTYSPLSKDSDLKSIVVAFQAISPEDLVSEFSTVLSAKPTDGNEKVELEYHTLSCKRRNQMKAASNSVQCITHPQYEKVADFLVSKYCPKNMKLFSFALDVVLPKVLHCVLIKKFHLSSGEAERVMYTNIDDKKKNASDTESDDNEPPCPKRPKRSQKDVSINEGRTKLSTIDSNVISRVTASGKPKRELGGMNKLAQRLFSKCRKTKNKENQVTPIDVSTYKPKRKDEPPKKWITNLDLLELDRNVLLDPVGWINDSIVNAAQKLLKKQFSSMNGLQDVALGYVMSYEIQTGEFVQILHSLGNHWLTISSIGLEYPKVKVFDSLYDSIPTMIKTQIASLLFTQESKIEVIIMDVQRQEGSYDCGIFAIAFATALAYDMDPVKCFFDQKKMRRHLYRCLINEKLTPFPQRQGLRSRRAITYDDIEVHCYCRMPELKNVAMIECSVCSKWFHVFCDEVEQKCLDSSDVEWLCQNCK